MSSNLVYKGFTGETRTYSTFRFITFRVTGRQVSGLSLHDPLPPPLPYFDVTKFRDVPLRGLSTLRSGLTDNKTLKRKMWDQTKFSQTNSILRIPDCLKLGTVSLSFLV